MESVQGSWQYEALSSANETNYLSSPSSPALYGQMSPYADQGMWDDFGMTKEQLLDPFIGSGGDHLLSATGNAIINAASPSRVLPVMAVEEKPLSALYVNPNLVQPLPVGDPAPVDDDWMDFLGETLDINTFGPTDQTEAQQYLDVKPEPLSETSVALGSPVVPEVEPSVDFEDLITIDATDLVPESELEGILENGQAISIDEWIMDQNEDDAQDENTTFETSYDDCSSAMNESSYMDSSSQLSSAFTSDAEDDVQEETIDALRRFDLPAAQAAIVNSNFAIPAAATYLEQIKPERRGRKPSSATSTKSWHNVKDKSLRKKHQNKIAATKYRQKKKEEAKVGMVEEAMLQAQFSELSQKQQSLADKIRQVKELLKEKYNL